MATVTRPEPPVTLELTCEEARYLHALLQNYHRYPDPEPPREEENRGAIWTALDMELGK